MIPDNVGTQDDPHSKGERQAGHKVVTELDPRSRGDLEVQMRMRERCKMPEGPSIARFVCNK